MALKPLNSVAGFSVGETPANIILANGDITTNNLSTTGKANLNAIGNVIISGGSSGQVIQTDGLGNLSFVTINTSQLANGNSNVQVYANSNVAISVGGTSNIATFTSTGMNVAGYITGANITATGNISVNNYIVTPASTDLIVAPNTEFTRFYSNVNPYSGSYSLGNSLARWDNVFVNTANILGNVSAGNVLTNNLLYANGQPWDLQEAAGANTQIQYNDGNNNFGASNAFTFDYAGNILTVVGNSQFNNANLGNLATANFVNVSSNTTTNNLAVNVELSGNTANFSGNVILPNLTVNLELAGNTANFSGNVITPNLTVNLELSGNTANFTGNITSLNASLGNLATANFVNVSSNLQVTDTANVGNLRTDNLLYANGQPWDLQEAAGANTQIQYNDGNTNFGASANFTYNDATQQFTVSGNAQFNNANLGNLATANNFSTNGSGGDVTLTGGNVTGANVVIANSFTSNGGTINFATNNPNVQLGNVGNVHIGGGTSGYVLRTDGAGNLSWIATGTQSKIFNENSNVEIPTANGNVYINANGGVDQQWIFANTGNTTFPGGATANLGNLITANYANFANDVVVQGNIANANNISVTNNLEGNTANFSGNITALNANLGNLATANYANFANDVVVQGNIANANNISVTNNFEGNTANFSGNVTSLNANLGNLVTANYINVASNTVTNNLSVNLELGGNTANFSGNVIVPNLTVNLELAGNTANFTGNVIAANFVGSLSNGTSNVKVYNNANIEFTINGTANVATIASTGLYVAGEINTTTGNMLSNGNITANSFLNSANANVTGEALLGSVKTANITAPSGTITISAAGANNNIILSPTGVGNVDVGLHNITQVGTPVNPNDAATKEYVDNISQGLYIHPAANVTSVSNLNASYLNGGTVLSVTTISGGNVITFSTNHGLSTDSDIEFTNSFNGIIAGEGYFVFSIPAPNQITIKNGYFGAEITTLTNATGLTQPALGEGGIGATLTNAGAQAALTIDNILMTVGARVVVQGQTNQAENGIYAVTTVGTGATNWVLTRASDGDSYAPKSDTQLGAGSYFFIMQGSQYAGASYVLTSPPGEIHFGTSNIVFSQFSQAGAYSPGNGIAITGTLISANVDLVTTDIVGGNIVVKTSANLTTPNIGDATFSSITWNNLSNGNVTANNLSIGNIANITGNLRVDGIIESNGNISSNAYINGNNASFTYNANIGGNLLANNITSNNDFSTNTANVSANLVTSNATVNLEFSGNTANFSGNVILPNLTVNLELAGNTANFSGNVILPNLTVNLELAGNTANFTGNVVANNFSTTGSAGNISGANVIIANSFTSNGGTIDFATNNPNVKLGNVGNVHITGGSNGQILQTDGTGNLSWSSSPNISIIQNGTSNVTIPVANGNVTTNVNGNTVLNVTDTGANLTGYANISGNIFAPAIVQNASSYDTRIELSSAAGIIQANAGGNVTQFLPGGSIRLPSGGASDIIGGSYDGSGLTLGGSQTDIFQNRGGNVTIQVGTGGSITDTWTFVNSGNTIFPANGTVNLGNTAATLGNTAIHWGTLTTSTITANQTIASFSATGVTGVEYLVKAIDSTGSKYSVATVLSVTDGTTVDYTIYGTTQLGGYTGSLVVNIVGSNIALQVTPSSSNSTVWTTQYRLI